MGNLLVIIRILYSCEFEFDYLKLIGNSEMAYGFEMSMNKLKIV